MLRDSSLAPCRLIACLVAGLLCLPLAGITARAADTEKPALVLVVERNEILAGQAIALHVWVTNPTEKQMTDIQLRFLGPGFVRVSRCAAGKSSSSGPSTSPPIPIGPSVGLAAKSVLDPPETLCLYADDTVAERDINLAFSLTYKLGPTAPEQGIQVVEKKLSIGLFGTDSVGGVSLRLLGYVVPGMLLMMVLRLAAVPWFLALDATAIATLSVLVSVGLSLGAAALAQVQLLTWLFQGANVGVSVWSFVVLCLVALILGLIVVAASRCVSRSASKRASRYVVSDTDGALAILQKALGATDDPQPVAVVAKDGQTYVGSVAASTADGGVALAAWFELMTNDAGVQTHLADLVAQRSFREALEYAHAKGIVPTVSNMVQLRDASGQLASTADSSKRFKRSEIRQRSPDPGLSLPFTQRDPIVVKT